MCTDSLAVYRIQLRAVMHFDNSLKPEQLIACVPVRCRAWAVAHARDMIKNSKIRPQAL